MKSNSKTNEPEQDLFQIKSRKRKSIIDNKVQNITYQSLFDTYVRECRIKNLSETTIQSYKKQLGISLISQEQIYTVMISHKT